MRTLQEQKTLERRANRDERTTAREERLVNKKEQRKHELDMLRQQQLHETHMAAHQQNIAESEVRKMELQLEILKYQERVKGKSDVEPERGEGDDFMTD